MRDVEGLVWVCVSKSWGLVAFGGCEGGEFVARRGRGRRR